jgi:RNA polymerase sigma factor (sigma-70 family)
MNDMSDSLEGACPAQYPSQAQGATEQRAREFAARRRGWLLAVARNTCRNADDAEDLVQETLLRFIQAFEPVSALPNERSCEAWLVTTLTNLFRDQCRKVKVQENGAKELSLGDEVTLAPELASRPTYDAISDEQFAQAVRALSPKIRATFELHAAGMSYQEISRAQGIPVGTVAKRLHDARLKLRELLQRNPPAEIH